MGHNVIPFPINPHKIVLLLSPRLDYLFSVLFKDMGFDVLWAENLEETEKLLKRTKPDIAIEWQGHAKDYSLLNLTHKYWKETSVLLCLNWNRKIPRDFPKLTYSGFLSCPIKLQELFEEMYALLTPSKRNLLVKLWPKI